MANKLILLLHLFVLTVTLPANELKDAHRIYNQQKQSLKEGVNFCDGIILIKVSQKIPSRYYDTNRYEAKAMLKVAEVVNKLHQKTLIPDSTINFPRESAIFKRVANVIQRELSSKRNFESRVLVNDAEKKQYTYVVALANIPESKKVIISSEKWLQVLKKIHSNLVESDEEEDLAEFYQQLGCIEDSLYYALQAIAYESDITNYGGKATHQKSSFDPKKKIDSLALALVDSQNKAILSMEKIHATIADENIFFQEYRKMLTALNNAYKKATEVGFLNNKNQGICQTHIYPHIGHCLFGPGIESNVNKHYLKALKLFYAGPEHKNELRQHLYESIERSPAFPDSYRLLGSLLISEKDYIFAIIYLTQSLQLDNQNADTKANLAKAYRALGCPQLARSMAWSALLAKKQSSWSQKTARQILTVKNVK